MKIAILASGGGTNFQAIADSIKSGYLENVEIDLLISNRKSAYAMKRAENLEVESLYLNAKEFENRVEYDKKIIEILNDRGIELVVLAGYLRWISKEFVEAFENRILNIHPSLLPSFKGLHGIEQAYEYGVKQTGVTVHFVDETEDGGAIILQEVVEIEEGESLCSVEEKIHRVEHILYPKAIKLFSEGKLRMDGRKVNLI